MKQSLLFALVLAMLAHAQDYRAKIQGLITDPSGSAVAGAKVALRNTNTGVEQIKEADSGGQYIFDFVQPGTYSVTAEAPGFSKFVQENISAGVRGDVTVNIRMQLGELVQTVTVSEAAVALQFNTSSMTQAIDSKALMELPVLARNPFTLALLNPAVVNRYSKVSYRNPFYQLSTNGVDVGGQTSGRNDVLIDGVPIGVGSRGSYSPPMDAVQEFTIQQNSVDAEFGHSAGGILNVSMKSGTNEFHGSAYYFGRNPKFNALSNSVARSPNSVRNHVGGGTIGGPILKNRLFTFASYEQWQNKEPRVKINTLPTDLERAGDYSQSLNRAGGVRVIYDPWTTVFNAAANRSTRTAFDNNRIPASRMDRTSLLFLGDVWKPNGPGDDQTRVNNYRITYPWYIDYWNFSNRADWNISDKWKVYGRYSVIRTRLDNANYAGSPAVTSDNGGLMDALNSVADTVYTLDAHTVLNFRAGVVYSEDDYDSEWAKVGEAGLARLWPNNAWYKPYLAELPAVYYPNLSVTGASFGKGSFWNYHPRKYSFQGSLSKDRGRHYMKVGMSFRHAFEYAQLPNLGTFNFGPALTADTFIAPDTGLRGDAWATFLLGALTDNTRVNYVSPKEPVMQQYGVFFQDDIKLNRRLTLNLGLRYEYETAPVEKLDRLSRYLDLANPIPEMQATPPQIPADVRALNNVPYQFNGAWIYTDSDHRGLYRASKLLFLPRAGFALRVNDKTALRVGYARYAMPILSVLGYAWRIPAEDGFNASTAALPSIEGIPGGVLSDPFPTGANPLILPSGKTFGRYTNLGNAATWSQQNLKAPVNDRFNFTLERELPGQIKLDATYFINMGSNLPPEGQGGNAGTLRRRNMMDPALAYRNQAAVDRRVANPFFRYLTPDKFPGQLRNQAQVTVRDLLTPYPQYGNLQESFMDGIDDRYHALQILVQRRFARGYGFRVGYNYNRESVGAFFNDDDHYAGRLTLQTSNNSRHRLTTGGTYELPFGRGRAVLANAHPVANALLGGWSTSSIFGWNSGAFLRFGQMQYAGGDPRISDAGPGRWFDTSQFRQALPYTPRTNPMQFPGVTGPGYWNLDSTISKHFSLTERLRLEFRLEAYNLTNSFMWANPTMTVTSSLFGRSTSQENLGREVQYTLRLHW